MIAYSNLNLKPKEFWDDINPRDFVKMCEGFNLRNKREEGIRLEEMKLLRWIGYMQYAMHRDPKKRMLKPQELYVLNEPKEQKILKIPTKEEMKEIFEWPNARKLDDTTIDQYLKEKNARSS